MKISLNWLQDFIRLTEAPEKIAETLTSIGLEVENIEYQFKKYENIFTGRVVEVNAHPNANKLKICKVDIGKKNKLLQIVCGDLKVSQNQKVVVALAGATVPRNQHDPKGNSFLLEEAKIRGEVSQGMICSGYELDINDDADSILILPEETKIGIKFSDYLKYNDVIFEVAITPNRGDCLSHFGIARELGAKFGKKFSLPISNLEDCFENSNSKFSVSIKSLRTSYYGGRIIKNVFVGESPKWLKKRLNAVGVRSINNIVDVTNYVMLEVGQPLHAFDLEKIKGSKIVVKNSKPAEKFNTLDGKIHTLDNNTIMICDSEREIAIGGIMGGVNSEISSDTKNIFIEAAVFNQSSVRNSSKLLGIQSDASMRFERGVDSSKTVWALNRAAELISQITNSKINYKLFEAGIKKNKLKVVSLSFDKLFLYLGFKIETSKIVKYLNSLEIKVIAKDKSKIKCQIPLHRNDIEQDVDLIEEIIRLHGYEFIPNAEEVHYHFSKFQNKDEKLIEDLKIYLSNIGLNEIITNSFVKNSYDDVFGIKSIKVSNPISEDLSHLRTSLIPTMLEAVQLNKNQSVKDTMLFEIGTVYFLSENNTEGSKLSQYKEKQNLLITFSGKNTAKKWHQNEKETDFFDIKGIVETLFSKFLNSKLDFTSMKENKISKNNLSISIAGESFGVIGAFQHKILKEFGIDDVVYFAQIELEKFVQNVLNVKKHFIQLPKFPGIKRDLAIIVPKNIIYSDLKTRILSAANEFLVDCEIFDLYSGEGIEKDCKSIALSLYYQSTKRTLVDNEVDENINKIITKLEAEGKIKVRKK